MVDFARLEESFGSPSKDSREMSGTRVRHEEAHTHKKEKKSTVEGDPIGNFETAWCGRSGRVPLAY